MGCQQANHVRPKFGIVAAHVIQVALAHGGVHEEDLVEDRLQALMTVQPGGPTSRILATVLPSRQPRPLPHELRDRRALAVDRIRSIRTPLGESMRSRTEAFDHVAAGCRRFVQRRVVSSRRRRKAERVDRAEQEARAVAAPATPPLIMTSPAWEDGGVIPNKYTMAAGRRRRCRRS